MSKIDYEKQCKSCKKTKPGSEFHRNRRNADGYFTVCKDCRNEKRREFKHAPLGAKKSKSRRRKIPGNGNLEYAKSCIVEAIEDVRAVKCDPLAKLRAVSSGVTALRGLYQIEEMERKVASIEEKLDKVLKGKFGASDTTSADIGSRDPTFAGSALP